MRVGVSSASYNEPPSSFVAGVALAVASSLRISE
jgi:hypothetical protein